MKHFFSILLGFVFVGSLGVFVVALAGATLRHDLYAAVLLVAQILLVIFPFVIDERTIPKWLETCWTVGIILWFFSAFAWVVFQCICLGDIQAVFLKYSTLVTKTPNAFGI